MNFTLVKTSEACPEQYDVYLGEETSRIVGYIGLRFGKLYVCYPSADGEIIYSYDFSDRLKGMFDNEEERNLYIITALTYIKDAIIYETFGNTSDINYVIK